DPAQHLFVREVHRHAVALRDTEALEPARDAVRLGVPLRERERPVGREVAVRGLVAVARGHEAQLVDEQETGVGDGHGACRMPDTRVSVKALRMWAPRSAPPPARARTRPGRGSGAGSAAVPTPNACSSTPTGAAPRC